MSAFTVQVWNGEAKTDTVGPVSIDAAREIASALSLFSPMQCRVWCEDCDYNEVYISGQRVRVGSWAETTLVTRPNPEPHCTAGSCVCGGYSSRDDGEYETCICGCTECDNAIMRPGALEDGVNRCLVHA